MKQIHLPVAALLLCGAAISGQALAGDVGLHGFIRSALDVSDSGVYLESIDDQGDFGGSTAGLNYSTSINAQWSVAGQYFFKAKEGELGLDWAFATFSPNDATAVRFGRQKYPLGLVTENVDIGITYPWVRPPAEFYQLEMGSESANIALESFDGMSVTYSSGDDWEFNVQPFIGQHGHSVSGQRQMLGLKVEASSDAATLQVGVVKSQMTFSEDGGLTFELDDQTKTTVNFGANIEADNLQVYVEYADTKVQDSDEFDAKAGYATVAYEIGKYLPSITYAMVEGQNGALDQDSTTLAVAYDYNPGTVFKTQWKHVEPDDPTTGGLIGDLNGETSADIFSFTMDLVF